LITSQQAKTLIDYLHQIVANTTPDDVSLRINTVLAAGTFLTFVATAFMAWKTSELAKDTVASSVVADIHHQESQSGIVVWLGDRSIRFDATGIRVGGYLANVGPGAAKDITIGIQGPNEETDTHIVVFIPTLAPGAEYPPLETSSSGVPMRQGHLWLFGLPPGKARDEIASQGTHFKIKYATIFERRRTTWYPSGGRSTNGDDINFTYIQEFFDLNRDERLGVLLR